jgi:hypothetical protein
MKRLSAFACLALLAAVTVGTDLAQAAAAQAATQSFPAGPAAAGVIDQILGWALAAVPGLVIAGWAWLKAHAAQSAAKWDDEAVALVEKIAAGVVAKSTAPIAGTGH